MLVSTNRGMSHGRRPPDFRRGQNDRVNGCPPVWPTLPNGGAHNPNHLPHHSTRSTTLDFSTGSAVQTVSCPRKSRTSFLARGCAKKEYLSFFTTTFSIQCGINLANGAFPVMLRHEMRYPHGEMRRETLGFSCGSTIRWSAKTPGGMLARPLVVQRYGRRRRGPVRPPNV